MKEQQVATRTAISTSGDIRGMYEDAAISTSELKEVLHTDDLRKRFLAFSSVESTLRKISSSSATETAQERSARDELHDSCMEKIFRAHVYLDSKALNEAIELLQKLRGW